MRQTTLRILPRWRSCRWTGWTCPTSGWWTPWLCPPYPAAGTALPSPPSRLPTSHDIILQATYQFSSFHAKCVQLFLREDYFPRSLKLAVGICGEGAHNADKTRSPFCSTKGNVVSSCSICYTCRYEYSASSVLHFRWMLQGARQLRALLQYDPALCKYSFFLYILCLSVHTVPSCLVFINFPIPCLAHTYIFYVNAYFTAGTSMCIYSPVLCIPILHCSVHLPILFFCVHTKMLCVYIFYIHTSLQCCGSASVRIRIMFLDTDP